MIVTSAIPLADMEEFAGIKLTKLGCVSSEAIRHFIEDVLQHVDLEDLAAPCPVTVTNLLAGGKVVFKTGPVAVRAS